LPFAGLVRREKRDREGPAGSGRAVRRRLRRKGDEHSSSTSRRTPPPPCPAPLSLGLRRD
jgi:hypothetical protein